MSIRPHFARFGKPSRVISNSIDLTQYAPTIAPKNPDPRLVFLAERLDRGWNGIDKLMRLAGSFPQWRFDVIGHSYDELEASHPPNVLLHGLMQRSEYEPILTSADVAIGTLALHRINVYEISPLKVREYLAYGIPTIIGYEDTDFPEKKDFLLEIPNTPDSVTTHATEIEQFVTASVGKRVPREQIGHLDVKVKESQRLSFFNDILGTQ